MSGGLGHPAVLRISPLMGSPNRWASSSATLHQNPRFARTSNTCQPLGNKFIIQSENKVKSYV